MVCSMINPALKLAALLLLPLVAASADPVALIRINGAISPATAGYIARSIDRAVSEDAQCLIVQLDTPGGLLDSTKEIVQSFYHSRIPIVVYVAPSGANATSAGCFITLASDVAAMAPNTSIGAAHPVAVGGGGGQAGDNGIMKQKLENFTVSYMETIAQKRGRNVEWARASVRDSASITAEVALATQVIEIIAADLPDLLKQLDGRAVRERVLRTDAAEILDIPMTPGERVFQTIWRPEVLMILMMIAIYGIIGEVTNPGGILPGVVGVVALILALYLSSALPVNVAGVVLIVLAVGLFIAEAFTPTSGVLTTGGVLSFFFGLLLLFDRADPVFRLSLKFIIPTTIVTAAFFLFIAAAGVRALRLPVKSGRDILIGRIETALTDITPKSGKIFMDGAYWDVRSETPVASGERVGIVGVDGLTLKVRPDRPAAGPASAWKS